MVNAAATNAATATAERALIMTVPCEMAVWPVVFVDALVTKSGFAMPSRITKNGFVRYPFCFVAARRTKQNRPFRP
jgi:hypothetical protein